MFKQFYKNYCDLLDKRIENSTVIVVFIALFIVLAGSIVPGTRVEARSSILEYQNQKAQSNIIIIDGKKYKLIFESL